MKIQPKFGTIFKVTGLDAATAYQTGRELQLKSANTQFPWHSFYVSKKKGEGDKITSKLVGPSGGKLQVEPQQLFSEGFELDVFWTSGNHARETLGLEHGLGSLRGVTAGGLANLTTDSNSTTNPMASFEQAALSASLADNFRAYIDGKRKAGGSETPIELKLSATDTIDMSALNATESS